MTFVASTMATTSLEEIANTTKSPAIFQLYVFKDRGVTRALVERAEAAGFIALEVTGDVPVMGRRNPICVTAFIFRPNSPSRISKSQALGCCRSAMEKAAALYTRCCFDADLTWKDIEWLAGLTKLPVLVKGVLRGDDAVTALKSGAAGVVVSNHGGRQLDTVPATIRCFRKLSRQSAMEACALGWRHSSRHRRFESSGVGASAVQVGRPVLWGLATGGEQGAQRVMTILPRRVR